MESFCEPSPAASAEFYGEPNCLLAAPGPDFHNLLGKIGPSHCLAVTDSLETAIRKPVVIFQSSIVINTLGRASPLIFSTLRGERKGN
jgi:hypothetical protein